MTTTSSKLSLMSLYEAGAHRGSHRSRMNPKLKRSIHKIDRNSLGVIDLVQTIEATDRAAQIMLAAGKKKKQILVVGTSKYITDYTVAVAAQFSQPMPYVNYRWLGGLLTNWQTVRKTLKEIDKLENIINNVEFFNTLTSNEQLIKTREFNKKNNLFAGIRNLKSNRPGAVIVLDPAKNKTAILEAEANGVPVICFTNLNTILLPKDLSATITFNNTSLNAVKLIMEQLMSFYQDGIVAGAAIAAEEASKAPEKSLQPRRERPEFSRENRDGAERRPFRRDFNNRSERPAGDRPAPATGERGGYKGNNFNPNYRGSKEGGFKPRVDSAAVPVTASTTPTAPTK
jgi:small subunit ribosomal protein S2